MIVGMSQEIAWPRIGLVSTRPVKKIRIVCNGPNAIEHVKCNRLKRVHPEIEDLKRAPECEDLVQSSSNGDKNPNTAVEASNAYNKVRRKESFALTESGNMCPEKNVESKPYLVTSKYRGVQLRPSGKWGARIFDPISRKQVRLGSYNTAEEASHVYQTKRMEFNAVINGVQQRTCGKWTAVIRNPVTHINVCLGKYSTAEEASHAFRMKKLEYDALISSVEFSSKRSSNNVVKHIAKSKAILSNDSRGSAFPLTSHTSPSPDNTDQENLKKCKVVHGKHEDIADSAFVLAANAKEPKKVVHERILDEEDLDFAQALKDIPLFLDADTNPELPNFDFDFESEDWTDDEPIP